MKNMDEHVAVVGLGYVGLPLAVALDESYDVLGFDVDKDRISELKDSVDSTGEVAEESLKKAQIRFTADEESLSQASFIIVCVPTPTTETNQPDLSLIKDASRTVGEHLSEGSVVVYESTVYPGVTGNVCAPILEEASGLRFGESFSVGYSPERANPGDSEHTVKNVVKIVSGSDKETLHRVQDVYETVTETHAAPSIRVAEGAKVIENVQRDLNIALMNELAVLFDKQGIDVTDVLEAAGTKWNFHEYHPGLVGGHCIPEDPYYLTHRAELEDHHPEVILAGRRINDNMYKFYSRKILEALIDAGHTVKDASVFILGVTFKPNVGDYRNSRVKDLIEDLKSKQITVHAFDPFVEQAVINEEFGAIPSDPSFVSDADLAVVAVDHDEFDGIDDVLRIHDVYGL